MLATQQIHKSVKYNLHVVTNALFEQNNCQHVHIMECDETCNID